MDSTDGSNPLKNQVLAGYDKDGDQIYVGRTYHAGDLLPANVIPSKNVAYVSYAGEEIPKDKFEVRISLVFLSLCQSIDSRIFSKTFSGSLRLSI